MSLKLVSQREFQAFKGLQLILPCFWAQSLPVLQERPSSTRLPFIPHQPKRYVVGIPVCLANLVPAYTILFLVIGLLESDGLFVLIGYGLTAATTIFFGSIAGIIWQLATQWLKI
jgi:hypothetical protein